MRNRSVLLLGLLFLANIAYSQAPKGYHAGQTLQLLQSLKIHGTVLYVAAHPDDENTRLIAYLANERHLNVHYLSLTRGDGGQNLIGNELSEGLGVIRTQELIAARQVDGGKQRFSQARDFGFSKNPDETFEIWPKELILRNVVHTIRTLKPDVIITRFSPKPGPTHGHHTASAQLALEAFSIVGTTQFQDDMTKWGTQPWQPKRIFWNISSFFFQGREKEFNPDKYLKLDIGQYNRNLGLNYQELAGISRSQHKSQGFGSATSRGTALEYFEHLAGDSAKSDILDGIDFTAARIGLDPKAFNRTIDSVIMLNHQGDAGLAIRKLVTAYDKISKVSTTNDALKSYKLSQIREAIYAIAGLRFEATTNKQQWVIGETAKLNIEVVNRSIVPFKLISVSGQDLKLEVNQSLDNNKPFVKSIEIKLGSEPSAPYWLANAPEKGCFPLSDGMPIDAPYQTSNKLQIELEVFGYKLPFELEPRHKSVDPVRGELYQPLEILPKLLIKPVNQLYKVSSKPSAMTFDLEIEAVADALTAGSYKVLLMFDDGSKSEAVVLEPLKAGQKRLIRIQHLPSVKASKATAVIEGTFKEAGRFDKYVQRIRYDHIPNQVMLKTAEIKLMRADIITKSKRIAYVMGAGDDVPQGLKLLGYQVDLIDEPSFKPELLKNYQALVIGIRAYNTHVWLKRAKPVLLDYIEKGGNVIVQYNTANFLSGMDALDSIAPYPIKIGNERVTNELAEVKFELPEHPVLNKPNKLIATDFSGWVQERGLYFVKNWASQYQAPLAMHDKGENDLRGGLLVTKYGKGHYIYTGLSFFRQLPAGVPGAYRLMTNLIELGR